MTTNDNFYTREEIIQLCMNWFFGTKDIQPVIAEMENLDDEDFCNKVKHQYSFRCLTVSKNRYAIIF